MNLVEVKEHSKLLCEHIQQRRWECVRVSLRSPVGRRVVGRTHFCGLSVLSLSVGYNPPSDVVKTLVDINSGAVETEGVRGRMPLHLAAACGASKEVINLLLEAYPEAAHHKDRDGRTPLHYAVLSYCGDSELEQENASIEAVTTIFLAAPSVIAISDKVNGETPGQLASRMSYMPGVWGKRAKLVKDLMHDRMYYSSCPDAVSVKSSQSYRGRLTFHIRRRSLKSTVSARRASVA